MPAPAAAGAAPPAPVQAAAPAGSQMTPGAATVPALSMPTPGSSVSAGGESVGDKRKANYFEFAKQKWECEDAFRLPDGSCAPAFPVPGTSMRTSLSLSGSYADLPPLLRETWFWGQAWAGHSGVWSTFGARFLPPGICLAEGESLNASQPVSFQQILSCVEKAALEPLRERLFPKGCAFVGPVSGDRDPAHAGTGHRWWRA